MRAAAPSIWNLEVTESKKDYGVMVHTAMAKIKTVEDVEQSVNSMFIQGLITSFEKGELLNTINKIISLPQLKPHFSNGLSVKNESEIITLEGKMFRPDRVVLNEKEAVIIDYKTGEEKSSHKKQILEYADLLTQMGYTVTKKMLVYIEEEKVVEC